MTGASSKSSSVVFVFVLFVHPLDSGQTEVGTGGGSKKWKEGRNEQIGNGNTRWLRLWMGSQDKGKNLLYIMSFFDFFFLLFIWFSVGQKWMLVKVKSNFWENIFLKAMWLELKTASASNPNPWNHLGEQPLAHPHYLGVIAGSLEPRQRRSQENISIPTFKL